jgi:hypothetical protein
VDTDLPVREGYGALVPERLFVFIQMEFPWVLGPSAGRYLVRGELSGEPEHVLVLGGLDAPRLPAGRDARSQRRASLRQRWGDRGVGRPVGADAAPVSTTRATIVDPVSLSAETQARAWLEELDREREVLAATGVLNRVLHAHRIAAADPYLREVSPEQALIIRAGWGEGEQVADGDWMHARELRWPPRGGGRARRRASAGRSAVLRPQERLAALLGARASMLLCEELTLRARLDLDQGRLLHAAIQLHGAYAAALSEVPAEQRHDLTLRLAELEQLEPQVRALADAAHSGGPPDDGEALEHALTRLEALLRARTASGV